MNNSTQNQGITHYKILALINVFLFLALVFVVV